MIVKEIFYSLQGEGFLAGTPSIFIRLAGCPLSCAYCDTIYARDYTDGQEMSIEQIIKKTNEYGCDHFVITGGEPMVDADKNERQGLREFLARLKQQGGRITIETSGIEFIPALDCDLMSISPKLSNSEVDTACNLDSLQQYLIEYDCQLKFVVENENDVREVEQVIGMLAGLDRSKVMLMPKAVTRNQYLKIAPVVAELCKKTHLAFSPRLQILLWDNRPGR